MSLNTDGETGAFSLAESVTKQQQQVKLFVVANKYFKIINKS